jgi:spore photoproduct lyase
MKFKKEFLRLKRASDFIKSNFSHFGVNKRQEIVRLLYEISKRERISPLRIIKRKVSCGYQGLKKYLLQRRYPETFLIVSDLRPYLPKIELKASQHFNHQKKLFCPQNIFIEKKASSTHLARRLREFFPKAHFSEMLSLKDFLGKCRKFQIEDYNKRQDTLFIVYEVYDFFKNCPCTRGALRCGYHIFNLGFGCIFDCTYCYLQIYTNAPGIILPANIDRFFEKFNSYEKAGMRIGTGEFSDSLALDEFSQYSIPIIEFFRRHKGVLFEFKTKSAKIGNILKANHAGNIVISWSLNPQALIDDNEFFTASLDERLYAALKCAQAGYKLGLHFDPVIYFRGWEDEYRRLIVALFNKIKPKDIAWISIGTFRFSPELKQVIERRFPENKILNEELLLGYDDKLRYSYGLRYSIYKKMIKWLFRHSPKLKIYLCMEEAAMWRDLKLRMPSFG